MEVLPVRTYYLAVAAAVAWFPVAIVSATPPTRAEADRLFAAADYKAAATAYRDLLDACVPVSAVPPSDEAVGPGPGVVEPSIQLREPVPAVGQGGTPVLLALVNASGSILGLRVIHSSGDELVDQAALRAFRTAAVQPATRNGLPVKMWFVKPIPVLPGRR